MTVEEHPDLASGWLPVRARCEVCRCVVNRMVRCSRDLPERLRCIICGSTESKAWCLTDDDDYGRELIEDWCMDLEDPGELMPR